MSLVSVLNRDELLIYGPRTLRAHAIDVIESAIRKADPFQVVKQMLELDGDILTIASRRYDLASYNRIFVLGTGKATHRIALALEELLGDRISDGVVVLKHGEVNHLSKIRVLYAGHPIPDEGSLVGGRELLRMARLATERDLVFSTVTGGSSSLSILPTEGISWQDARDLNHLLLASGASIFEINAIRKHISQIKGGRLALEIFPAELINLTVSDVVGDALDYITDLTVPDTSTYQDAWNTLDKYDLWDSLPVSIHSQLRKGAETETPKFFEGNYQTFLLVSGDAAFQAAVQRCVELGYETCQLPQEIEGESQEDARLFVKEAKNCFHKKGGSHPIALVATGESTVTLEATYGSGGPNQEFVLSAALEIQGCEGMVVASIDIDGTDGPTDAAGGIVDSGTTLRAKSAGLDAVKHLRYHDAYAVLQASSDLVYTGPTGTNVNDIMFVLLEPRNDGQ
jgi:glycerate 2-kinase